MDRRTFRLRQIPTELDRLDVAQLLQNALGIEASDVKICSLAPSVNVWAPSQTTTLMLSATPKLEQMFLKGDEWTIKVTNLKPNLILDTHFRGLTALNDPKNHTTECVTPAWRHTPGANISSAASRSTA